MTLLTVSRGRQKNVSVLLPPSKSYTNRALIAASLAVGESTITNASDSLDTRLLIKALRQFDIEIAVSGKKITVRGSGGHFKTADRKINLGNAGTTTRFMASVAAIAPGTTILEGDSDMNRRPMSDLLSALEQAGVEVSSNGGSTPLRITGGSFSGGKISLDASKSSQFLSSLLLAAPYATSGLDITLMNKSSSIPYIRMTLRVMDAFGIPVRSEGLRLIVEPQSYTSANFDIEADISASTFFGAAAAITGSTVRMPGVSADSLQGDLAFFSHLERMGCRVAFREEGIEISGPTRLNGIEADLNDAPDSVPPLAVTAAFADGATIISNIGHLQYKETDRLLALDNELSKIGAVVSRTNTELVITPGIPRPSVIEVYNDHRIAMGFAVAGLALDGLQISNPECVEKSFPDFWEELKKFY